jgi:aspartyl-tRNA synthetase
MHRYRTHTCGELRSKHVGEEVRLSGWLQNRRDLGGVLFTDLRDHYGIVQLVTRQGGAAFDFLSKTPKESVISVTGKVIARSPRNVNPDIPTGELEVDVSAAEILGECSDLPFNVFPEEQVSEEKRLTNRVLDLRRPGMHKNIMLRSAVIDRIRRKMIEHGFSEFQTPILSAASPEGARDYLVPSRLYPGKFYALPQAPQQYKQLLMVAGFDRYFQIAPCFRDEDSRADRSPGEFYQLDVEMSFAEQEDVFAVMEDVLASVFSDFAPQTAIPRFFPRITYADSLIRFGTDKPDLRAALELQDVSAVFAESGFRAFSGRHVRALCVPDPAGLLPRSFISQMEELAVASGAQGLSWLRAGQEGSMTGPIAKFLSADEQAVLAARTEARPGSLIFLAAGEAKVVSSAMSAVRVEAARRSGNFTEDAFRFCWIVDFPMYEKADDGRIEFSHNPFSMPQGGLAALDSKDPLDVLAWQYDIVCNGVELSSGAVRNHRPDIMYRAFEIAGYEREQVDREFAGMIRAFRLGAPPHAGIAPGIDRIVMLLAGVPNIREVIAFPLNQTAQDLLMGAPAEADAARLAELHLRVVRPGA